MDTKNQPTLNTLQKLAGTATRMRRIFAFHYDQIQRELEAEIFNNHADYQDNSEAFQLHDQIVYYMEEVMNWPDADDQDLFNKQISE